MTRKPRFRTGDQALVREINLSLIMQRLFEHTALSRAALAEHTGLNKSTVSSLVQELHDMHFVREIGLSSRGVGRPSMMLELDPDAGFIVSAELGVDYLAVKGADFGAHILNLRHEPIRPAGGQTTILDRLFALVRETIQDCQAHFGGQKRLLGVALGVPGLVDQATGTLLFAPNLHWENVPLLKMLRDAFAPVPVFVENEANLAALGEYFFGAAKGYDEVLYLSAGIGLGGAVVRGGEIAQGKAGFASEFGHMTMDPGGERCGCGNRGCWETQVNQSALFRHVRRAIEGGADSALAAQLDGDLDGLTLRMVVDAALAGDDIARSALAHIGQHLGIGIASLVNALNPDLVLLGGPFSVASDLLLPVIESEVSARALRWHAGSTTIMMARHGADACTIGGIATVCQKILTEPAAFRDLGSGG